MNIFEFEDRYKEILENIDEWVVLRFLVGKKFLSKSSMNNKISFRDRLKRAFKKMLSMFFGFKNWFSQYEYIFFSASNQRKRVNGKQYDKLCDPIIEKFGVEKSLMVEENNSVRYATSEMHTRYITSKELLQFLSRVFVLLMSFFTKSKYSIDKDIESELSGYNIDLNNEIFKFHMQVKFYEIFFKIYKPKVIFVVCSYCNFAIVKAAKNLCIEVVEIQHGIINQAHYGYNSRIQVNKNYYPDLLLSFGTLNLETLLIENVYPVGHYYIDYLKNNFKRDFKLHNIVKRYKYAIGISMQHDKWELEAILDFIETVSMEDKDILYLLIPRFSLNIERKFPSNVILYDELDCYQTVLHCNFHMTLYSSCAIEMPTLGIANILVDTRGMATTYYKALLSNIHTKIIKDKEDFFDAIKALENIDKNTIMKNNQNIIVLNYNKNIDNLCDTILNKKL